MKALATQATDLIARGSYDSAITCSDRLLAVAAKEKADHYLVEGWFYKGSSLYYLSKPKEALTSLYAGLKLCRDTSDNAMRAMICNHLGLISFDEKDYNTAKRYFREEISIKNIMGKPIKAANCMINLSSMHRKLKEVDSSTILLKKVGAIVGQVKDRQLTAYYYNALGANFKMQNNLDSAAWYFKGSLKIRLEQGNKSEALKPLFNLGLIYQLKKDYKKALGNYLQAKQITDELNMYNQKVSVYGNLAELYYDLKDYKNTADYFRRYIELNDSLRANEIKEYGMQLDKQYQIEKNEIIKQQKTEIEDQTKKIEEQNRRIFISVISVILIAAILVILLIYSGFKKRLNARIEEAKQKFFSNVVHEIRTPLSMIQAPLKVLKPGLTSPEDLENIEMAERNIARLNELVTQMLDISKLDSDKYILNETFGDLDVFFQQVIGSYEKIAAEKNITIASRINLQKKLAFFDKDALEKITGNLLGNAIKYTAENRQAGVNIDGEETEKGIKLTIHIWDTGIGISEKEQSQIFSRFYRSEKNTAGSKGVGIGLSLVKDLVGLQHGTIELVSQENKGSAFTITLFLKSSDEEAFSTAYENIANETDYQVMLVEDDKDILDFNARYLEKNNFKVLKAVNGKEALKLLAKNLPDIIVSDLMMPDMDGLSFLKSVKGNPESDHIPFVVLSAKASAQARMEALQAGAQNYLPKPFLPDELVSVIKNQLDILSKKKSELKKLIEAPEKKVEEKFENTDPYIQKLFGIVLKHLDDPELSVEKLADLMAINRSHFQRKVKSMTGFSPSEIIKTIRLEKAKELLLTRKHNITEVAYQTGFSSQSYFTKCFTQHYHVSPTQMLQQNV